MFFAKKVEQIAARAAAENLEWEQANRRSQSARVVVKSWFHRTQPGLRYQNGPALDLTFEGHARLGTTPNVPVCGEIEIRDDIETPRFLLDHWETLPDSIEGHASLASATDPGIPEMLYVTLYCTREAFDSIVRVFMAGFSVTDGRLALDLQFGYPDDQGEEFWKERWQKETLQVATWDARCSAGQISN